MEELVDLMVKDESPSETSDKIKEILFAKSAERVEAVRPQVSAGLFGEQDSETYEDDENDDEDENKDYIEEEE